ncbi:MAG TPA: hypothetical protein VEF33_08710 [Syntrophales bacterium]|nr:hypothetical protein [Syntrophales bacterium]
MKHLAKNIFGVLFIVVTLIFFVQQYCFAENTNIPEFCRNQVESNIGFSPNAITLTPLNVRSAKPEYSFLKGQWILGNYIEVLPVSTYIEVVEDSLVGELQIWYSVKYRKGNLMKKGWVWAGTVGVDDGRYIGGYKSKYSTKQSSSILEFYLDNISSLSFATEAFAQTDTIPVEKSTKAITSSPPPAEGLNGGVKLGPIYISIELASGIVLFVIMVLGMLAKAVWDQTEQGGFSPPMTKIVRPLLVSPIAFSAFMGTAYLKEGFIGINLTAMVYSFQVGFMWQHVLETRGGVKESNSPQTGN